MAGLMLRKRRYNHLPISWHIKELPIFASWLKQLPVSPHLCVSLIFSKQMTQTIQRTLSFSVWDSGWDPAASGCCWPSFLCLLHNHQCWHSFLALRHWLWREKMTGINFRWLIRIWLSFKPCVRPFKENFLKKIYGAIHSILSKEHISTAEERNLYLARTSCVPGACHTGSQLTLIMTIRGKYH